MILSKRDLPPAVQVDLDIERAVSRLGRMPHGLVEMFAQGAEVDNEGDRLWTAARLELQRRERLDA